MHETICSDRAPDGTSFTLRMLRRPRRDGSGGKWRLTRWAPYESTLPRLERDFTLLAEARREFDRQVMRHRMDLAFPEESADLYPQP